MFANIEYPKHKMPLINIPPIVYSNESGVIATKQDTKDIPSSSSFAHFMKSLVGSSTDNKSSHPPVQKKVSFVKNNRDEFVAVPYDSAQNGDFVEITGNPLSEGTTFYAKPINNPNTNTDKTKKPTKSRDDEDDNSDDEDTNEKKNKPVSKDTDDYIFHIYVGSLSVIGLLILFRIIQKS